MERQPEESERAEGWRDLWLGSPWGLAVGGILLTRLVLGLCVQSWSGQNGSEQSRFGQSRPARTCLVEIRAGELRAGEGRFDPGRFDPGRFDPGTFDPGTFDPGTFDPGTFDPARLDPAKSDQDWPTERWLAGDRTAKGGIGDRPGLRRVGDPSVAELRQVTGIGGVLARRILASRWAWLPCDGAWALAEVEGLGPVRRARLAQQGLLEHEPSLEFGARRAPGDDAGTLGGGVSTPVLIPADAEPAPHPSDG